MCVLSKGREREREREREYAECPLVNDKKERERDNVCNGTSKLSERAWNSFGKGVTDFNSKS